MDLFALDGNTLKVYLGLVAARDTREVYVLSHSALSRQVRLARHTVLRALHQLERGGWIQGEAGEMAGNESAVSRSGRPSRGIPPGSPGCRAHGGRGRK